MHPGVTPFGEHGALPFSPTLLLFSESRTSSVSKIGKLTNGETKPSAETGGWGWGGWGSISINMDTQKRQLTKPRQSAQTGGRTEHHSRLWLCCLFKSCVNYPTFPGNGYGLLSPGGGKKDWCLWGKIGFSCLSGYVSMLPPRETSLSSLTSFTMIITLWFLARTH